jgi:hypothetical protein
LGAEQSLSSRSVLRIDALKGSRHGGKLLRFSWADETLHGLGKPVTAAKVPYKVPNE